MAYLYVTEFARQGRDSSGQLLKGVPEEPALSSYRIALGAESAASGAFNALTTFIRVQSDMGCSIALGAAPTATTSLRRLASNCAEFFSVPLGGTYKIAAIANPGSEGENLEAIDALTGTGMLGRTGDTTWALSSLTADRIALGSTAGVLKDTANLSYLAASGVNVVATTDASLGEEKITNVVNSNFSAPGDWTGTDWAIDAGTFKHTPAGANAATLAVYPATAGLAYLITITVVTTTAGTLTIGYGGATSVAIGQVTGTRTAYRVVLLATTTGGLVLTPDATWLGTVDNISIKQVIDCTPVQTLKTAAGAVLCETRLQDTQSVHFGLSAGQYNIGSLCSNLGAFGLYKNTGLQCSNVGRYGLNENTGDYCSNVGLSGLYQNLGIQASNLGISGLYQNIGNYCTNCGAEGLYRNSAIGATNIGVGGLYENNGSYCANIGFNGSYQNIGNQCLSAGANALYRNTCSNAIQIGYYATTGINKIQLAAGSWTATGTGTGTVVETARRYRICAVINGAETELSTIVIGSGAGTWASYVHANIPVYVGPKTCTARRLYRYNSVDRKWYRVYEFTDNTTESYTDTQATADYSGGLSAPPSNVGSIGNEAKVLTSGDFVFGDYANPYTQFYFGGIYAAANQAGKAVTLTGMGGYGTDKAGGMVTVAPGKPTGTALTSVRIQGSIRNATGTGEQTLVDRIIVPSTKTLSDNSAVDLFEIALPSGAQSGGLIQYCIILTDGTDYQTEIGIAGWAANNKAGSITTTVGHTSDTSGLEVSNRTSGTLSDTWACTAGTNKVTVSLNANSSLTPTSMTLHYTIINLGPTAITQL